MTQEVNIHQLAKLAKIEISPEEEAEFEASVSGVLHWIDRLQEIDVSDITLKIDENAQVVE